MMSGILRKPLTWAIGIGLLALAAWWVVATLTGGKSAQVEAGLRANQVEAATRSGADAVQAVGEQASAERAADQLTEENDDAIRNAEGADAPIAAGADAAGRASLCKRAAYRGRPECLQHAPAR